MPKNTQQNRRDFIKTTGKVTAASALAGVALPHVHANVDDTVKVALIGAGGRGSGASLSRGGDSDPLPSVGGVPMAGQQSAQSSARQPQAAALAEASGLDRTDPSRISRAATTPQERAAMPPLEDGSVSP